MSNNTNVTRIRFAFVPLVAIALLAACGSDDDSSGAGSDDPPVTATATLPDVEAAPETAAATDATTPEPTGTGTIDVRLEEVDGIFIEGFEVGLRFETPDGEVIGSTLWSDFVAAQGEPDISAYYDSVLEQAVPSGELVVMATVNVGIGPAPEVPDLDGDLRCRLAVDVPANGSVEVVVTFSGGDDCLELG